MQAEAKWLSEKADLVRQSKATEVELVRQSTATEIELLGQSKDAAAECALLKLKLAASVTTMINLQSENSQRGLFGKLYSQPVCTVVLCVVLEGC